MEITVLGPLDSLIVGYIGTSDSVQWVEKTDATTQFDHLELTFSLL